MEERQSILSMGPGSSSKWMRAPEYRQLKQPMHIRRTDSNKGRPAIKDGLAIPILTLAQGFSKQLDIPFPERLKPHRIRHEDFDGSTMIPGGQIFHGRSKKGRIAPPVTAAANFVPNKAIKQP